MLWPGTFSFGLPAFTSTPISSAKQSCATGSFAMRPGLKPLDRPSHIQSVAFTLNGTYGMNHLEALEAAGLTHLHQRLRLGALG